MPLITLDNISLRFAEKLVLNGVNASILKGDKIALIGRNGEGKSSLMNVLAGTIHPDDGEKKVKSNTTISYLEQYPPTNIEQSLFEVVARGLGEIGELIANYYQNILSKNINQNRTNQDLIEQKNAWHYLHKVEAILNRFNLNPESDFSTMSGGWKKRVMLARALIQEPDLLLLDEPTNHMDIKAILDLEKMLKDFHGTIVLISHDRSFIQAIANKVFDLDRGNLAIFDCGYLDYTKRKENIINAEELKNTKFNKKLAQEEAWIRQGIKARRTRNEGRVRALKEMRKAYISRRKQQGKVKLHTLENEKRISKIVFEVKKISYQINQLDLIKDFSLLVLKGDKIGIIGGNGTGKSTLIKLLLNELTPDQGGIRRSKTIEVAYFDQMRESLNININMKAMDFVSGSKDYIEINGKSKHIIGYLRKFLFTAKQAMSPIKIFSGGEKNRLMLAKILSQPANLLVLDEPTNDLDVETLELLEDMLVDYKGTVIIISHDRTFLNNVVSSTIVMEGNAIIEQYAGGYDDYLEEKSVKSNQKNKSTSTQSNIKTKKQKLSYKQKQDLKILTEIIENLESDISNAQNQLSDPSFYQNTQAINLTMKLREMELELEVLYEKWSNLDNEK